MSTRKTKKQKAKNEPTKFARLLFERNLSIKKVKEMSGVSHAVLNDLKKGHRDDFKDRTLQDIADALSVQVSDIINTQVQEAKA